MNIYKNPAFPNGAAVFQSTSKLVPFCSYLGLIFAFSHNPVLWRNAGPGQLCVLSRPSCVDLTRQSQTCWRQPPDVIHSPRRALWALAAGPPPPPLLPSCGGEERSNRRSESPLVIRHCHSGRVEGSKPRPLLASADALWRNEDTLLSKHSRNLCNEERAAWLDENEYKPTQRLSSVTPQVYITVNKSLTVSGKSRKLRWWTLNTSADIFQRFKKLQHFEILSKKKKKSCSLN